MILQCQRLVPPGCSPHQPWLVFLHGLLGSGDDWQTLGANLQSGSGMSPGSSLSHWPQLRVDLPGHGASVDIAVRDFAEMDRLLALTLRAHGVTRYWLVGYSLGGRIAMHYAIQGLAIQGLAIQGLAIQGLAIQGLAIQGLAIQGLATNGHAVFEDAAAAPSSVPEGLLGLLVEGSHPGLPDEAQRQARREHDGRWAQRLRHEPLPAVLDAWYRQAVFTDQSDEARQRLIALRSGNDGAAVAAMLEATSLGRQPWLLDDLKRTRLPFGYLCGVQDNKFQAIAQAHALPLLPVPQAGHNAHRANPAGYAQQLDTFIAAHASA